MSNVPTACTRAFESALFAHNMVAKMVSDFPESKAAFQTSPTDNHVLWHLGHLALDYQWFAAALDGKPTGTTEVETKLFGMGSKPIPDAKAYPTLAELKQRFEAAWQRLAAAAQSLRGEDATKPTLIDSGGFLKDRLHTVEASAWHDGWHAGQISGLRKALGLKGVF